MPVVDGLGRKNGRMLERLRPQAQAARLAAPGVAPPEEIAKTGRDQNATNDPFQNAERLLVGIDAKDVEEQEKTGHAGNDHRQSKKQFPTRARHSNPSLNSHILDRVDSGFETKGKKRRPSKGGCNISLVIIATHEI